jgi:tetratricopeptide (TPR) repeat protein
VPPGLVEFLGMSPVQRRADYRSRVEKAVRDHPEEAAAQVAWLKLLLEDGSVEQALIAARRIGELKAGAEVLAEGGRALLQSKQYAAAKEMLTLAAAANPPAAVAPELAIATAEVWDAAGKHEEAIAALRQAFAGAPPRSDIYWEASGLLVRNGRISEALRLFERAADSEMLLMKAVLLELDGQTADALKLLSEVQERRPEWFAVWVARGMMRAGQKVTDEARQALETAVALGAHSPEVRDVLAGKEGVDLKGLFLARPPREW